MHQLQQYITCKTCSTFLQYNVGCWTCQLSNCIELYHTFNSTPTSVIGRTIKIWFRLPQPIMRHAIMTDFPEVNALIITVWRYSPSQNIQAKLQTIAYCVMTWRNWHQSCGIDHSPSNKLNPYLYSKKKVPKKNMWRQEFIGLFNEIVQTLDY